MTKIKVIMLKGFFLISLQSKRLCSLIKKFFDKTSIENEIEFDECFKKTLYYIAKYFN